MGLFRQDFGCRERQDAIIAGFFVLALHVLPTSGLAAEPIATADGEQSGTRIDITELKRTSGDTITLKFTLINDSGEAVNPYGLFNGSNVAEVHLIDAAGKKKYLTIKDTNDECVCSGNLTTNLESGKSMNLWAKFPAPPADVQEVSVVFPHFIPTDVPISK